ncbi:MFS transporter [Marinomonas spartinae]|uniref:MFS transporter n=1 Tax=Marinomonas spartinae TaxID=1792290 RepID=UPI0018F12854|nr:MFS transporter [Marinomonas spartinae]MBJ7555681.1 MFS transporter [Marinomonas spartinae]
MVETGSRTFWRGTIALVIGSFMVFANVYVTQPLLPMIANEFHVSALQASASFTITTLTLGISLLFYGPISDAFGRKGLMVMTLLGVTCTTYALSVVHSFETLLLLRGLQGFFLAGLPAIAVAYLGDEYRPEALMVAVGLYIGGNTLGGIGGRLIGGFVGEWMGRSAAFAAMAGISLVFLIAFIVLLPASKQFESKPLKWSTIVSNMLGHLSNRRLVTAYVIGGLSFFVFINQYSYITFRLESKPYQLSSQYIGLLFLTYLAGTVGSAVSGRLAQRLAQPYIMVIGTLIFMLGSVITLSARLEIILCGLAINCFGFFLCHSTASSFVSRNAKYAKASASSLYLVGYYLGGSMGGYYLDPFWRTDQWQGVIIGSLIVLGIVVLAGASLIRLHQANGFNTMTR